MCPNLRENIRCGECWYAAPLVILHTQYVKCVGNITYNMEIWKYYIQYLWNALEISHGFTGNVGAWVWKYKCGWELSLWKIVVLRILWGSIRILRSQLENTADGISSLDIVQLSLNMIVLCLCYIRVVKCDAYDHLRRRNGKPKVWNIWEQQMYKPFRFLKSQF